MSATAPDPLEALVTPLLPAPAHPEIRQVVTDIYQCYHLDMFVEPILLALSSEYLLTWAAIAKLNEPRMADSLAALFAATPNKKDYA